MNVYCLKPKKPLMFIVEKEPKKTVPILVLYWPNTVLFRDFQQELFCTWLIDG